MLGVEDFSTFFAEVHDHEPFPWQRRLLEQVIHDGSWPRVLDLPTGSGKTAAIDIAIFHLALEAGRGSRRSAPVRVAFVVDRRLVVDDAFRRAKKLEAALRNPPSGSMRDRVARQLKILAGDGPPLVVRALRGGIPREDDWARTPAQPTVLCSTVDQVGSRILFRGYGVSDSMKPVHAGLLGSDCLILLDEAHLAEPFRQTLEWIGTYQGSAWRQFGPYAPWSHTILTATPGEAATEISFALTVDDRAHPILSRRLRASKPARLIETPDQSARQRQILAEVQEALREWSNEATYPAIGVVVNRVARARDVFRALQDTIGEGKADLVLMIGPSRPWDRSALVGKLESIRTGAPRSLHRPLILVATQCLEAGVDIDLDGLITEAAPIDALRQRFGRLNRDGRDIKPYAAIVATKTEIAGKEEDPVYGLAIQAVWKYLAASVAGANERIVDFGVDALAAVSSTEMLSPKDDAPVLLPAHVDMLSQTSPVPPVSRDVSLFLHGARRQPASITVIWRADIFQGQPGDDELRLLFKLVPPRAAEAVELPLWAVRRWLARNEGKEDHLADLASAAAEDLEPGKREWRGNVFRWAGEDERTGWVRPGEIRAGDTIIVPASYGGLDVFGWVPEQVTPVIDVAREAARPYAGRRFAVRVAPGLLAEDESSETERAAALSDALASASSRHWRDLRDALAPLDLPDTIREDLRLLDQANRTPSGASRDSAVVAYMEDVYGLTSDGKPRGIVFLAPYGIAGQSDEEEGRPNATEDEVAGSLPGYSLSLAEHSADVKHKAESFARAAGLPEDRIIDLTIAGYLHDLGKADPRFQAWLHQGDLLGSDREWSQTVLAKSDRALSRSARFAAGLPYRWRHEATSVRLARLTPDLKEAKDQDLVLWLVGVHHGFGRPLFPHADPDDSRLRSFPVLPDLEGYLEPGPGPASLAFDWQGLDWPALFEVLKVRYGPWELARMEAILRLADHRASQEAEDRKRFPEIKEAVVRAEDKGALIARAPNPIPGGAS